MKSITPEIVYNTTMDEVEKLGWDLSKRELVTGFSFLSNNILLIFPIIPRNKLANQYMTNLSMKRVHSI